MRRKTKQAVSALTAAVIAASMGLGAAADTTPVTPTAKPEITVVAKRIKGDNRYIEISLEVNGNYEDYTSVGAVLEYDPAYIVPADSWDDGAGEADLTTAVSWATRRALPTLGVDTWSTHTATTYLGTKTDGGNVKPVGYLYLGAEYPGKTPNTAPDTSVPTATPNADGSTPLPTDEPTPAPTAEPTPTPDPNATPNPDPYTNPVVAARFMYAKDASVAVTGDDDTAARSSVKTKLVNTWQTSWNTSPAWKDNTILTIADDSISAASPAQFGFSIYKSDFTMKGFQHTIPTPSFLETSEQAAAEDIEIVLGEGKSAKSGGLSLSDIYVTLFYDWDNTLIGSLTCGAGADSTADVSAYAEERLVHPQLRPSANASLDITSKARADTYRGEYPETGPNASDPLAATGAYGDGCADASLRGSAYPLTNKLDYVFAGRSLNTTKSGEPLPYAGGWTRVTPETLEDTWTALDSSDNFANTVDTDNDGAADTDADGNYLDASGNKISLVSYSFSDTDTVAADIDGGVLYVKAVYEPGSDLNNNGVNYRAVGPAEVKVEGNISEGVYSINFEYRRINSSGYGVTAYPNPAVEMFLGTGGASVPVESYVERGEVMPVSLIVTKQIDSAEYLLRNVKKTETIVEGSQLSDYNDLGIFTASNDTDYEGYQDQAAMANLVSLIEDGKKSSINYTLLNNLSMRLNGKTKFTRANQVTATIRNNIEKCVNLAKTKGLSAPTYYQLQIAVAAKGCTTDANYMDPDTAFAFCQTNSYTHLKGIS